jgi:putative OPT family oligopeptide transporter
VYLALTAGLTVTASIPIAVLAIAVLRRFGSTILENNIVQTIGSAGESVAAGVVFTIPALIFLSGGAAFFHYWNVFSLALVGGTLGVLFMVPLRRALIVQEQRGGNLARMVFAGLGIAVLYRFLMSVLGLWKETPVWSAPRESAFPRATVDCAVTPEYLGVGYIIGPRIAGVLVAGGVLSQLVLVPLIAFFGDALPGVLLPGGAPISTMDYGTIRGSYVRYIGAGAVAAAGMITLIKTLPTIAAAFRESFSSLRDLKTGRLQTRTERDIPITVVLVGSLVLVVIVALLPQLPSAGVLGGLMMGLLVVVFGFFFVTVSSRIVGIIGSSSNPISGMTIATLMATCLIFVALGWTGEVHQALALCVGGIVCIAAANAGNTSQDLKTGYLVGATPIWQQVGLIIGVGASVFAIGGTLWIIDNALVENPIVPGHAIGSDDFPAPQATLMATIIRGILAQDLPWALIFIGMAIAVVVELCGVGSLSFAVGLYLPLSTTLPIFVGGMLRGLVERRKGAEAASELSSGMLYATGLVAGGALSGVLIAGLQGWRLELPGGGLTTMLGRIHGWINGVLGTTEGGAPNWERLGGVGDLIAVVVFALLCGLLVRAARKELEA